MVTPSTNTVVAFLESSWLRSWVLLEEFSPKDRSGSTDQVRERETVLFSLAILLLLGPRSAALFYPG